MISKTPREMVADIRRRAGLRPARPVEMTGPELAQVASHPQWTPAMLAMPYAFDIVSASTDQRKEMSHWCRATFGPARRWKYAGRAFFFSRDVDAVLFKLRWL